MLANVKKILFPTDFSKLSLNALPYAGFFSASPGVELHLLHGTVLGKPDAKGRKSFEENIEHICSDLQKHFGRELKITLQPVEKRGIAAGLVILNYAEEENVDLIVMATHGHRGVKRFFLGSVAEEVVRSAKCPILTIRNKPKNSAELKFKRILVPIDFSTHALEALRYAKIFADEYGAEVQVMHVVETRAMPDFYRSEKVTLKSQLPEIEKNCFEAMKTMVRREGFADSQCFVATGLASEEIRNLVERNHIDLIVIATHGLTGLKRMVMGSVAESVVREASCPVLTVRSYGKTWFDD